METTTLITSADEAVAVGAVAGSMFAFVMFFVLAYWLLTVIATWKIFKKAGEPGWKSIIPIYNVYVMYKIVGMKTWFWCVLLAGVVLGIIMSVDGTANLLYASNSQVAAFDWSGHMATVVALLLYAFGAIIVDVFYSIKTSKAFGHGVGYAIGLILLQPIFWLILGFGSSKYNKKEALSK